MTIFTSKKNRKKSVYIFAIWGAVAGIAKNAWSNAKQNVQGTVQDALGGIAGAISAGTKYSKLDPSITEANTQEIEQTAAHTAADPLDLDSVYNSMGTLTLSTPMHWRDIYRQARINNGGGAGIASDIMGAGAGSRTFLGGAFKMLATGIGAGIGKAKLKRQAKDMGKELARTSTIANKIATSRAISQAGSADNFADYSRRANYTMADGGHLSLGMPNELGSSIFNIFNTGGTHEENPYGGIPQGIAADGLPNLVEEGEVKIKPGLSAVLDDYIFSNRSKVDKELLKKYPKYKNKTYATVAKNILKEYDSNPNNEIIKNTTKALLEDLYYSQEMGRRKKQLKGENRLLSSGGHLYSNLNDVLSNVEAEEENDKPESWDLGLSNPQTSQNILTIYNPFSQEDIELLSTLGKQTLNIGSPISLGESSFKGQPTKKDWRRIKIETNPAIRRAAEELGLPILDIPEVKDKNGKVIKEAGFKVYDNVPLLASKNEQIDLDRPEINNIPDNLLDYLNPLSTLGAAIAGAFTPNSKSNTPKFDTPIAGARVRSIENKPRPIVTDYQRQATRGIAQLNSIISAIQNSGANPYVKQAMLQNAMSSGISSLGDNYQKAKEQEGKLSLDRDSYLGSAALATAKLAEEGEGRKNAADIKRMEARDARNIYKRKFDLATDAAKAEALSSNLTSLLNNTHAINKEQTAKQMAFLHMLGKDTNYTSEMLPLITRILSLSPEELKLLFNKG